MTLQLDVRIATNKADRVITRHVRALRFRSVVPGGFSTCTMSLSRPLNAEPDEILYYARVYVYDSRSGATVWEGRLEDTGRSAGDDGETWDLAAIGGSGHAQDSTICVVYVDRRLDQWDRVENIVPGAKFSVTSDPGDPSGADTKQALVFQFPDGQKLATNGRVTARYDLIRVCGQKLARYNYSWDAGVTSPSASIEAVTRTNGALGEASRSQTFSTAGGSPSARTITTSYPNTRDSVDLRILYTGVAGTITNDDTWASVPNVVVLGTRYTKLGVESVAAATYGFDTVLASDVVADLLGRTLPRFDGAGAVIATTVYAYDQLTYEDGATPAKILDDLMSLEPAYFWAAWESSESTGDKFRFEWSVWPTTATYEATVQDGWSSPGSTEGLYNRVVVRWKDNKGRTLNIIRAQFVPALSDAGSIRQAFIDLGDEVGSASNAIQVGDTFLLNHRASPNNGTLTIARPIQNLADGRMVEPWEIRPGRLIRVRGVTPTVDSLNAGDRDAVTLFRIVATEYDADSGSTTLELDTYSYDTARAIAIARKPPRRRR